MPRRVQGRLLVVSSLLALAGSGAAFRPASAMPAAPPDDTFEVAITSGTVVAPGGTISFTGICWSSVLGAAREARVRGTRHVPLGSDIESYDFTIAETVNPTSGAVSGTISVPGDAPNGIYDFWLVCLTQDQYLGDAQQPFTIDGPQITTTTSSVPLRAVPPSPSAPAPARPLRTTAELTG